jgi:hypothetical protein
MGHEVAGTSYDQLIVMYDIARCVSSPLCLPESPGGPPAMGAHVR